ncbi:hypothetical protein RXV94_06730 [Yeosuana sp. MJ-SS3]|uniref:Uncharacterized protein n=1 Tax=Gilvirhabdus luticola TaxID=3079858 RepID=A0ABU3U629_9FLAO|nr:hypothetical protein [Yeosuana sp. MJ-SS3]MDU8885850.1 hypothetical protein [Yeosuana sp. MJ-SS3]
MKNLLYFLLFVSFFGFGQDQIETKFISKEKLSVQSIVDIDDFGVLYYINSNIFYKKEKVSVISYNNLQLGNIYSINTFNPLKINVFYNDFNSVIILDNRLAEIFKIDFNKYKPFRNVSQISTGNDNTIWLFNQDTQQLELYDYKSNKTRATTLPVVSQVLDLKSNFNECWLLTENYIYRYNYFGSLLSKIKNNGFSNLVENNGDLFLQKGNKLYFLKKENDTILPINMPELLIKQFLVTNETLYIYNEEFLHKYQLITR